jgi:HK97 family phage major capsid protein
MLTYLRRLVDERTSLTETMCRSADQWAAEERDPTEAESSAMVGMQTRCAEIDRLLEQHNAQAESMRAFAELQQRLEVSRDHGHTATRAPLPAVERTTWGQAFIESDQYRSYSGVGQSGRFPIEGYLDLRAPITTAQLDIPPFQWTPPQAAPPRSPLLELCSRVTVSSGVVDWVQVGPDPVAAVVAEAALKPEAAITLTPQSAALDTLAHWVQITRQALDDAAYMRSLIETKLRRGLVAKAEADMAAAIIAATLPTATGDDLMAAIRVGIGTVESAGYVPNAVALNPADFAALDIAVMGATNNGPTLTSSFWGLTPVAAASITAGTAVVGDFTAGATLFDRGVTNVFLSDSHAALFISNILVILAEARLKSAVTEPAALCECTAATTP